MVIMTRKFELYFCVWLKWCNSVFYNSTALVSSPEDIFQKFHFFLSDEDSQERPWSHRYRLYWSGEDDPVTRRRSLRYCRHSYWWGPLKHVLFDLYVTRGSRSCCRGPNRDDVCNNDGNFGGQRYSWRFDLRDLAMIPCWALN